MPDTIFEMRFTLHEMRDTNNELQSKLNDYAKQTQTNPICFQIVQAGLNKLFRRVFCVPIGFGVFVVREDLQVIDVN